MNEGDWQGVVAGQRQARDVVALQAFMNQSPGSGGSKPLLALGADGLRYWVKPLTNPQGPMVPANEQVVARCGALIGVPACEVRVVEIPEALAGTASGVLVEAGLAHGSRDVPDTVMEKSLGYRTEDDNRRRHVGVFALYDWCWGSDGQWLYALRDEHKTYSHDHGYYFPGGRNWPSNPDQLRVCADQSHLLQDDVPSADPAGLDAATVADVADRLEAVSRDELAEILRGVPPEWPVTDEALELLGFFHERRAPQVAGRLRSMI